MADDYRVIGQRHVNDYDPATGQTVRGWWVSFTDQQTNVTDEVFVPDTAYPQSVASEIRAAIGQTRQVSTLTE
jgi:2-keto-4-pentenoate hydratase